MQVVFAAIFIAVATGIATILCFLPGVLIAFLTSYTLFFIVDQQLEAAEAIQASVKMVWHNFGHTLLFLILALICVALGVHRARRRPVCRGARGGDRAATSGAWRACRRAGPLARQRRARAGRTASAPAARSARPRG